MTGPQDFPFVITRTLNAPRALVWECYTKLEYLKHWWGPAGYEWIHGSLDFRPGGMFHYGMRAPNGVEMWGRFVYRTIAAPEALEFVNSFSDPTGAIAKPPYPGMENFPPEVMNRLSLEDEDDRTRLTLQGGPHNANAAQRQFFEGMLPSMNQGFAGTFAQLDAYLETLQG